MKRDVTARATATATAIKALMLVSACLPIEGAEVEDRRSAGRTVEGRLVDASTGDPVPFVNLGIPGANRGTVGDEQGAFRLEDIASDHVIVFIAIGYERRTLPVSEFPEDGTIRLVPAEIAFHEAIEVRADPAGTAEVLGHRYSERGYGVGYGNGRLGAEIGAAIKIKRRTYLESANFPVTHPGGERFLYRVNLYDFDGGEVGENLLSENLLIDTKQERGTITIDLRDHGLIVDRDVLLTLEWVRDDRETGNANVMFRAKPRSKGNLYLKPTPQMPFFKVRRHGSGFHLIGYSLD